MVLVLSPEKCQHRNVDGDIQPMTEHLEPKLLLTIILLQLSASGLHEAMFWYRNPALLIDISTHSSQKGKAAGL